MVLTDQTKRNEQIKTFKNQLRGTPMTQIISIDETSIDSHIGCSTAWSKSGHKTVITKNYPKIRYTAVSAIDDKGILHTKIIKGSCNGEIFLEFVKELHSKLQKGKKYTLLIDNARIHHYCKFKEYVNKHKNISIIYNVPYSPESNPIERVFSELKYNLQRENINNTNILNKITKAFKSINNKNMFGYFNKSLNFYGKIY